MLPHPNTSARWRNHAGAGRTLALFVPAERGIVATLGGLTWKRNQFCRGWLITGDTGSGKTSSGINQLAHQVFQNEPTLGRPVH
jgi:hypothetical protein